MSDKLKELRDKQAKITSDQHEILDKADKEKRGLTADEETNYGNLEKEFDSLKTEIDKLVKDAESIRLTELRRKEIQKREEELRKSQGLHSGGLPPGNHGSDNNDGERNKGKKFFEYRIDKKYEPLIVEYRTNTNGAFSTNKYMDSYKRYLVGGLNALTYDERNIIISASNEVRALQADSDKGGGFLVAPEQMVMQIIEALDNIVFVRQYANVIPVPNAASLGAPARDTDIGDATWTAEIRAGDEDNSLDFEKRELTPHPIARYIKVSKRLVRVSLIDIVSYVAARLAYKHGIVQENAYLNGTGVNQPLGVFIASAQGINTDRDVSAGNTSTAMTGDGLINAKYALKKQYRSLASCRWCFHRDGVKMIRKLKDGDGQYLWKQGLSDRPDTILEIPFEESEYAPSIFTTGLYVGILGDWRTYWIAQSLNMEIQVATERYIETNQNAYFGRAEVDGMPTLSEAWVRVKLA